MRILTNPDQPITISATVSTPAPIIPAADTQRTSALERLVDAMREKIRGLEERLHMLEQAPKVMPAPVPVPVSMPTPVRPVVPPVTIDPEAFKKNLLNKMWKYLQEDERPPKAI